MVFTATKAGVTLPIVRSGRTNDDGKVVVDIPLSKEGAWAIVGSCEGESHTWWVQVAK